MTLAEQITTGIDDNSCSSVPPKLHCYSSVDKYIEIHHQNEFQTIIYCDI